MKKTKILHVTPHLGGGVGRVLLNYFTKVNDDQSFVHEVTCLDYANKHALDVARNIGILLTDRMACNGQQLLAMIAGADIVLIHWWNHPLLYDFLVRAELPSCRVVMWSHISGFHPPYVFTGKIFRYPDVFVFTTPVSYEAREVQGLSDEQKKSLRVVWSTGGVEHVKDVKPNAHTGFNVGYIGTVDYCKMHPDFLNMCSQVDIPDVNFIVCGGPKEKAIQQEAERIGIDGKFTFTGPVSDITQYLSAFDVLGYPLAPYHYGTCDQALAESMACGVVPVVFSNRMENHMVKDGVTGIVVNNKEEYGNAIKKLFGDKELKMHLSENAKEYARKTFSLEIINQEWKKVFEEILVLPKTSRKWEIGKPKADISAKDVFLESLGGYNQEFISYCDAVSTDEKETHSKKIKELAESPIWQARTRGSAHHYHVFFPEDEHLAVWSKLMREYE
ncbi:MAG: glycosyltransferase [Deltaproteobacteria bacterium]|nr:glycosyltransferase [Deltaproteobacteria bacterium]